MFTLSICARSVFTLSAFVLAIGSPGAGNGGPALSDASAADQERAVVARLDEPQEGRQRRAPSGARDGAQPRSADSDQAEPPGPPPVVRFEAAAYRLALSTENAVRIDAASLAEAGTLVEFDEALRALGDAQVLYRVDQTVNLRQHRRIRITADEPYVTGSSKAKDGRPMPSVARRDVGAEFDFAGEWAPGGGSKLVHLWLQVEIDALEESRVETVSDVAAPVFRGVEQQHGGLVGFGRPIVMLSLDGACTDRSGRAVAFITRVVLRSSVP
jgi:hypothetical protein